MLASTSVESPTNQRKGPDAELLYNSYATSYEFQSERRSYITLTLDPNLNAPPILESENSLGELGWQVSAHDFEVSTTSPYPLHLNTGGVSDTQATPHRYVLIIPDGGVAELPFTSTTVSAQLPPELHEALDELREAREEAREDGGVIPSDDAVARAERVLRAMYELSPRPYAVYPMPDGEIAVDAHSRKGTKVVVLCASDGSARCLVYIDGDFERKEYADSDTLPDHFIKDALGRTRIAPSDFSS